LAVDRDHNNLVLIQRLRDLRSIRVLETGTRKIERIVLSPEEPRRCSTGNIPTRFK